MGACVARRLPFCWRGSPPPQVCISIVSALTPEMANRVDLVSGVLPPGVPAAARTLVLALGLGMVWLSRGLARRKRRAWWLALAVVAASAVAHLAKGLDFEEATVHLILLVALLRARRQFVAPGDPATILPLAQVGAAFALCLPLLTVLRLRQRRVLGAHRGGAAAADGGARVPGALALAAADPGRGARGRATETVRRRSSRSTVTTAWRTSRCAATRATSSRSSGRSFLAYRVVGGTALVAGDPIGADDERHELIVGVPPRRAREGLARRDRRRVERRARRLRGRRFQVDLSRRRSSHQARRLHARRPRDPQGAPVGLPAREERLRGARAHRRRRRRARCAPS